MSNTIQELYGRRGRNITDRDAQENPASRLLRALRHALGTSQAFRLTYCHNVTLGRRDFYRSWDQVEVPLPHEFLGLDAESLDLTGLWEGMADRECKGVEAKWYAPETMPAKGWVPVHCNEQMLFMYRGGQHGMRHRRQGVGQALAFGVVQMQHDGPAAEPPGP